jgi:hypothetical protein
MSCSRWNLTMRQARPGSRRCWRFEPKMAMGQSFGCGPTRRRSAEGSFTDLAWPSLAAIPAPWSLARPKIRCRCSVRGRTRHDAQDSKR